ncbi:MAG: putative DNA-binding domain-containing protein [Roseovarius sp.]
MTVAQSKFHTALLDPQQPVPEGLSDGQGQPAGARFAVYRNNVASSLTEALEISFPVIQNLIGEENFKKVASIFLRQHPPKVPMLAQYGDDMPAFLEGFKPLEHLGYLPDVARLEQALRVSYHAADATPIDPSQLQSLTPQEMAAARFSFAPAMILQRAPWPIHGIWVFNTSDGAPKPPTTAQSVLVLRPDYDPTPHLISEPAATCVTNLIQGATLSDANDAALQEDPEFDLGALLGLLLGHGAITNIQTGE